MASIIIEFPYIRQGVQYTTTLHNMNISLKRGMWSEDEHDRFLHAIQIYPHGPWRFVAQHVGTRDVRQVQTHAQKYYEKISRHLRGLRKERRTTVRPEHRIDDLTAGLQTPDLDDDMHSPAAYDILCEDFSSDQAHSFLDFEDLGGLPDLADVELPSLEESLDILLQFLSDD